MMSLTDFILKHWACDRMFCTTCGGIAGFIASISAYEKQNPDLEGALTRLTNDDAARLSKQDAWPLLRSSVLVRLDAEAKSRVFSSWNARAAADSDFAVGLLRWFSHGHEIPPELVHGLAEGILPAAQSSPEVRDLVAKVPKGQLRRASPALARLLSLDPDQPGYRLQ